MKRRQPDSSSITGSATSKKRRTVVRESGRPQSAPPVDGSPTFEQTPETTPSRTRSLKKRSAIIDAIPVANGLDNAQLAQEDSGRLSPQSHRDDVFRTPQKSTPKSKASVATPSRSRRADRSAKRKSASALLEREDEED